ncbi:MAG: DNA polymerase III subunit alpha, partial [Bdellovibrionales bacterium]|nr:DNA polymerase III subunit alpha [Bdellovibrionales bacterium]
SLVAYSLKITDLDPMKYNLIFERFLNPERISMPDFDIDFCQDRRQEVIEYVTKKYTEPCVSQIITFGKLQTKAAIRDVGRVLGMTFAEVDVIAKLIPEELGISLASSIEKEPRLRELMEDDPKISQLMELAQKVEGLNRHASIHAAGVIISDRALVEHAPLYKGAAGENVVQYDMKYSEQIGLIKFDFLGLKTLTHINNAFKLIEQNRGKTIKSEDISLQDKGIYELMSEGDTVGVFQFEGSGITDLIRKVKPTCFEDITAINALYRPGPMQMLDEYTARKHGTSKITYLFNDLEDILKETYGIIVYQEQVQLIAAKIASYSLGEADILRRAMGKKIPEEMAKQRSRFLDGANKNGFDAKKSEELFDLMDRFAAYGFNKSHAAAYCVVAAQTAWLKKYYPAEFFAALLSTEMSNTEKVVQYVKDARNHGIEVRPPHVNHSEYKFTVKGDVIYFGLGAIKGVGEGPVENIVQTRASLPNQKFETIEEFFDKLDGKTLNKKVLECLIKAGALDDYGATRSQLMACYETLVDRADTARKDRELGQTSLFELAEEETEIFEFPKVAPFTKRERLAKEKEVLGFFLTDHPLIGMEQVFGRFVSTSVENLQNMEGKSKVILGGIITAVRERLTRKATRMAFFQVEDLTGETEIIAFPDVYEDIQNQLVEDEICIVTGIVERDGENVKVIAED